MTFELKLALRLWCSLAKPSKNTDATCITKTRFISSMPLHATNV
ncbi:hypothetical protein [Xanthomarina gelatinilytica]